MYKEDYWNMAVHRTKVTSTAKSKMLQNKNFFGLPKIIHIGQISACIIYRQMPIDIP